MVEHATEPHGAHPAWLALATDGPAVHLSGSLRVGALRVVSEPEAFLRLLSAGRPRVAIVGAPPATGPHLAAVVLERRRRSTLRIVHLAPPDAVDERLRALELGFDESLPTTIAVAELAGRLALLDRRGRARTPTTIGIADGCQLDLIAHELRRDGRTVHLRPKEFQLLLLLASHPGRTFTRAQLIERIWGAQREVDPRTVDVHVRWLREKLEVDPSRPSALLTVRGVGYLLERPAT